MATSDCKPQPMRRPHSTRLLKRVFDGAPEPLFITNEPFVDALADEGLEAMSFDNFRPEPMLPVVFLPLSYENLPPPEQLRAHFGGSCVLWVPLASFDPSPSTAKYSLSLLLESDFEGAVAENRRLIALLLTSEKTVTFDGSGALLEAAIDNEVYIASRSRATLSPGEHASIGSYFEVGMHTPIGEFDPPFRVEGSLRADGIAAARHRESPRSLDPLFDEASHVVAELRQVLPLNLVIRDNGLVASSFGSLGEAVRRITNERYDLALTELAFGTNHRLRKAVDWRVNSQLNEGAGALHVAVGDGLTGIHIDFISAEGELSEQYRLDEEESRDR